MSSRPNYVNSSCHTLVSDFDHRNPRTALDDVETGRYLEALQQLSQHTRQLFQDGDSHLIIDDEERVLKHIRKRDPENRTGRETYFVVNKLGTHIPVTEEEFDQALGIEHNPEDIYEQMEAAPLSAVTGDMEGGEGFEDSESETLGSDLDPLTFLSGEPHSEYIPPMDRWDIILDQSEWLQVCTRIQKVAAFMQSIFGELPRDYWKFDKTEKLAYLNERFDDPDFSINGTLFNQAASLLRLRREARAEALKNKVNQERIKYASNETEKRRISTEVVEKTVSLATSRFFEELGDELIYSADVFMPNADKRLRTPLAKKIAGTDLSKVSKQNLARMTASQEDKRPQEVIKLRAQAVSVKGNGRKAGLLLRAQAMTKSRIASMRAMRSFKFVPGGETEERWVMQPVRGSKNQDYTAILSSERRVLWDLWRQAQILAKGSIELPSWMFQKMYSALLSKRMGRGELTAEEATTKLREVMTHLYKVSDVGKVQLILDHKKDTKAISAPVNVGVTVQQGKAA